MKTWLFFVVAQVIPSAAGGNPCDPPPDPTDPPKPSQIVKNVTVPSGGSDRIFSLYIPADANGPLPAVIHWHGFNYHYPVLDYHAQVTKVLDQAEKSKFVVIMPLGTQSPFAFVPQLAPFFPCDLLGLKGRWGWNSIDGGLKGGAVGVDDELFAKDILDYVKHSMSDTVDQSRVYTAGFSNGAFQAYGTGCRFPDSIAGVGANAGTMKKSFLKECRNRPPVPVQSFHSVSDNTIPYDKTVKLKDLIGLKNLGNLENTAFLDLLGLATQDDIDEMWRHRNRCTGDEQVQIKYNSSTTTCRRWDCPGAPVESCTVHPDPHRPAGLKHCWIGGDSDGGGYKECKPQPGDIDATAHMFEFWDSLSQYSPTVV